eukprot:TRINITY_DN18055_c0_g1_i1.p1 TRINITY_DN18055_c0_g1~~TRINITY_DN18055_c0_g1_i1.p1  ORF type:complete len:185 (+),score=22.15 TRINITY_DN18055_c0_g1_i1:219-773(+)
MSRSHRGLLSGVRGALYSLDKVCGHATGPLFKPGLVSKCMSTIQIGSTTDLASSIRGPSGWRGFAVSASSPSVASASVASEAAAPQPHYEFLEIVGVGYRAVAEEDGAKLMLKLGFSHDVNVIVPEGMKAFCLKPTAICVAGLDKVKVSQFAAYIRGLKPPEPYKGKGIRYRGELVQQKQGKKK